MQLIYKFKFNIPAMKKWNLQQKTQYHLYYYPPMKHLHINLAKYVQDLYEKKNNMLMNKSKR